MNALVNAPGTCRTLDTDVPVTVTDASVDDAGEDADEDDKTHTAGVRHLANAAKTRANIM